MLARIESKLDKVLAGQLSGGSLPVADDRDLDSQYGDPDIKFTPKRGYNGPDFKGQRMSQATPEFLDVYAEALQYSSEHPKSGREKYATYDARNAARARGWSKRLRSGWRPPGSSSDDATSDAAEVEAPF